MTSAARSALEPLDPKQRMLLVDIVNSCGSGQHPFAYLGNLPQFHLDYLRECVTRALREASAGMLAEVRELASAIGVKS